MTRSLFAPLVVAVFCLFASACEPDHSEPLGFTVKINVEIDGQAHGAHCIVGNHKPVYGDVSLNSVIKKKSGFWLNWSGEAGFLRVVTADKLEAYASGAALSEFLGDIDTSAEALLRLGFDGIEIGCNDPASVQSEWAQSWTQPSDNGFDVRVDEAGCSEGTRREFHVTATGIVTLLGERKLADFITHCATPS